MLPERDPDPMEVNAIRNLLKGGGIGATAQRVRIACALFARPRHMSADQVLGLVNQRGKPVSKATVYNTLKLFVERGLIRQVIVDPDRVFYDSNTGLHHHFYNEDTGALTDFGIEEISISGTPVLPPDTVHAGVDVIVRVRNRAR